MIGDFKNLPGLAKWFLQSNLETIDIEQDNYRCPTQLLNSQTLLFNKIFEKVLDFQARTKSLSLPEFVTVCGEPGIGKSIIVEQVISRIISEGYFSNAEVLCVSVKEHNSVDSFYSLCSKIARKLNLRKDSAALEELEGSCERKDAATLNVLKKFRLVFIDDIDADEHEIWQHVLEILKASRQSLQVIGTCSYVRKADEKLENMHLCHVNKINEEEVVQLFDKMINFDGKCQVPEMYIKAVNGIPSNVCILSKIINVHKNIKHFISFITNNNNENNNSLFSMVVASQLDCRCKFLLDELCKLRIPLPANNLKLFDKLLNFGLAIAEYKGTQAFISVPSSVKKIHKSLTKCDLDHNEIDFKNCSAKGLWKDNMSPKLREILIGCQTENWTFVPESW